MISRRGPRIAGRVAAIAAGLLYAALAASTLAQIAIADDLSRLSGKQLAEAFVRQQIRDLRHRDADGVSWTTVAAVVTASVGVGALVLTLSKAISDSSAQRNADRTAAEAAAQRRFDEQFNILVSGLGADQPATRVAAAVGLTRMLTEPYSSFHEDVAALIVANLKIQTDSETLSVLRRGLERILGRPPVAEPELDLARANLAVDRRVPIVNNR